MFGIRIGEYGMIYQYQCDASGNRLRLWGFGNYAELFGAGQSPEWVRF